MSNDHSILFGIRALYSNRNTLRKPIFQNLCMTIRETVLENIDRFKARDGISTDQELARMSKVPQSTFSKLRNGKQQGLSFTHLERLANFFGTDPARFFTKQLTMPSAQLQAHMMVAEKLSPSQLEPLTQTGLILLESIEKPGQKAS